jgi:hypothetical protein
MRKVLRLILLGFHVGNVGPIIERTDGRLRSRDEPNSTIRLDRSDIHPKYEPYWRKVMKAGSAVPMQSEVRVCR